jgi:hypothetical protein
MRHRNRHAAPLDAEQEKAAGHAPGKRHLGQPPDQPQPPAPRLAGRHDQPWLPLRTLVGRVRRSTRRQ